ncbi:SDR family NAD(P)-dependent oxidoreductase [Saccharopolyspora erythraea]|uniref:SDR family NAD(P)-dependent oxidoreductase n=1 Tax=Saccharopolyspora erythraea TaxID=1836 RepID=UPI001BA8734D|nr:SDR family oxidoreductase [Saccharopolyspora erythraea]
MEERDGPVVVITGAGSGIGRAAVDLLAAQGVRVAALDVNAESMAELGVGHARVVDVTDEAAVTRAIEGVAERFGRIDGVVNCAGRFLVGALDEVDPACVRDLLNVNILGTTLVTQSALPHLRRAGGAIVNVSSLAGVKPTPSNAHYSASKAAVAHLARCWALELGADGIRVNAVAPGPVLTGIYRSAGMSQDEIEKLLARRRDATPLRRDGTAEEVALWISRLVLADEWVTGQVIAVDGGLSIS